MQSKKEITELLGRLKPVNWILIEHKNGLMKKGKFLASDDEFLYINEQRVMATGLIYEGKANQVPQMVRTKYALSDLAAVERTLVSGTAGGTKASKRH